MTEDFPRGEPIPLLALIGPTAVGKTALSLELAEELGAEVISVDSRQVYRLLDVGTDKIDPETRRRIPHHLIDLVDPDQIFTAADFARLAGEAIGRIRRRGRVPLLVGGTPFYYRALAGGVLSEDLPSDPALRRSLEEEGRADGAALHGKLRGLDPVSAERLHPGDLRRVARALEISLLSGEAASSLFARRKRMGGNYDLLFLGLNRDREALREAIALRVRKQFSSGYPEEVRRLLSWGYAPDLPSLSGFGYRELVAWAMGKMSLEEAQEGDIAATRAFSRRQMTWFRKFDPVLWYDLDRVSAQEVLAALLVVARRHLERGSSTS
jgi:tRNA dimethylallyltransferase